MVRVIYDLDIFEGYAAAKSDTDIWIYDENWNVINHISGIYGDEWNFISIENGEWTDLSDVPDPGDFLRNRINQLENMLYEAEASHQEQIAEYEAALARAKAENPSAPEKLVGVLSGQSLLTGKLTVPFVDDDPEMPYPKLVGYLSIPDHYGESYEGSYEVVPSSGFQLLNTEEKFMKEDILVHPIPYAEVSNPGGGYTAIFGG